LLYHIMFLASDFNKYSLKQCNWAWINWNHSLETWYDTKNINLSKKLWNQTYCEKNWKFWKLCENISNSYVVLKQWRRQYKCNKYMVLYSITSSIFWKNNQVSMMKILHFIPKIQFAIILSLVDCFREEEKDLITLFKQEKTYNLHISTSFVSKCALRHCAIQYLIS